MVPCAPSSCPVCQKSLMTLADKAGVNVDAQRGTTRKGYKETNPEGENSCSGTKSAERGQSRTREGALCAEVIRLRVSYHPNDETLSRNSLMNMSNANFPIAVH